MSEYVVKREFPAKGYVTDREIGRFSNVAEACAFANIEANEASGHEEFVVYAPDGAEAYWTPGKVPHVELTRQSSENK